MEFFMCIFVMLVVVLGLMAWEQLGDERGFELTTELEGQS